MSSPKVRLRNGEIEGRLIDRESVAFLGIPYARPPVGSLRFKKPEPAPKWDGVKDCTKFGPHCPYIASHTDRLTDSSEDCLYLNVYAPYPDGKFKKDLPVFVYIHGGGFVMDCSNKLGVDNIGRHLCSKDIVVVSLNYRLAILGFLCWGKEYKGNYGLFDMKMALEWVVHNIGTFGGNPSNVTVGGQSAGAAAVDLLAISPLTRDLFQNCINFAGSSYCAFALRQPQNVKQTATEFARKKLGAEEEAKDSEVLELLKTVEGKKLAIEGLANYGPVIDGEFFPEELEALRRSAPKKTVLVGVTEQECLTFGTISKQFPSLRESVPFYVRIISETLDPEVAVAIYDKVVDDSLPDSDNNKFEQFVKFLSELFFNYGTHKMVKHRVDRGEDVYLFQFKYFKEGTNGSYGKMLPYQAASHCMELPYMLGKSYVDDGDFDPDDTDHKMIDIFTGYLSNFVKTGNPNGQDLVKWNKVNQENYASHLCIDLEPEMHDHGFYSNHVSEFDQLFKNN
ncbi:unnamed protein product [Bursaphelenchus okinawaensis]|uniref:Carboxylic ester hydrolase n=1 Tax=Bursaphelenchus okinawaensis TaxID=465554 RepID=A0A811JS60_9BILA|nr:unnamed protein product [Bursaphelenchus okinawaensis]CAG9081138.1 unnamed protein product [Bursaphelenchus okinawaensis]